VRLFTAEVRKGDPSLQFRVFPNRSLISAPFEQLAAMRDGTVEMAVYPLNYGGGQIREFSVTTLPGLIRSMEHGAALRQSAFADTLQEAAMAERRADRGVVVDAARLRHEAARVPWAPTPWPASRCAAPTPTSTCC